MELWEILYIVAMFALMIWGAYTSIDDWRD